MPRCDGETHTGGNWCATLFLGEQFSPTAVAGIGLVVVGTVVIHTRELGRPSLGAIAGVLGQVGTRYALRTGLVIAAYSALDKYGVSRVTPVLYGYLLFAGLTLALPPVVLQSGMPWPWSGSIGGGASSWWGCWPRRATDWCCWR